MDADIHIESILHLSALSLIVAIAYLGLDRVHLEKDAFLDALEKARARAVNFVRRCDIKPGERPDVASMFYRFPFWVKLKFYALCQIAEVNWDIDMGSHWRIAHWCHRQRHVPLFGYFKKRRDRAWVSIFAAALLAIFLYMTAAALWSWHYFPPEILPETPRIGMRTFTVISYWVCTAILLWIFLTVGITHLLQHIESICINLEGVVDDHMKKIAADVTRNSLQSAQNNSVPS
jgi:hypothetical protein